MKEQLATIMFTDFPFYYREGNFGDIYTIKENINGKQYKMLALRSSDVVLDIGAHIGTFAVPVSMKVHRVISVEMDLENYNVLALNTEIYPNISIIRAAVVSDNNDSRFVEYYRAKVNSGSHSIFVKKGRGDPIRCDTIKIGDLLDKYSPSIIKCDVEGSEYGIFEDLQLPDFVRQIIIEFHFGHKDWRDRANNLISNIIAQGFRASDTTDMTENKNWTRVVYFRRELK